MKSIVIYITDNFIRFGQTIVDSNKQLAVKEDEINIASLKDEEIIFSLKKFLQENKIAPEYLILGVPRTQVSVRYLSFPAVNDNEIRQMVEYDLNNLFPFKPEELISGHAVISKSADGYSQVMLIAVQREIISKQISLLKKAGLVPDEINISTISLFNQFCGQKRPPANYLLINLDDGFMDMILISGGKLVFSRGASFNAKTIEFTLAVLRDKGFLIDKIVLSGKGLDEKSIPYEVEIDRTLSVVKGLILKNNGNYLKLNLLPQEVRIQKHKAQRRRSLIYFCTLLLLNLSLVANIIFLKIKSKDEYLNLLKSEIKKIENQASALQKKMLKVEILQSYLNSGKLKLSLLSELYRIAPEGIFLSSLDISGNKSQGTVVLIGQAKDRETVLKFANAIKSAGIVTKADVNYMTKRKLASEQMVDFEIRASF